MPRVGDINLTPLEYADEVRKKVLKVSPSRLFTYKYIWKRADQETLSIRFLTGMLSEHEKFRDALVSDDKVISATAEYISEIDINYQMLVDSVKKPVEKKEEKVNETV